MKTDKYLFPIVTGLLVLLAITGLFQEHALSFVKSVAEKNLNFLALISEIKLVLAGLNKINIAFISGHSGELQETLGKAQDDLLKSNATVLIQIMLLSVSKSLGVKITLVLLFVLTFYERTKKLASKFLVLLLAITPGLAIFTLIIHSLSVEAKINFGHNHLKQMEATVKNFKEEKAQLMEEHAKQITALNNGSSRHHDGFRKLKEDVSYDFKKTGLTIHGDYATIRLLISEAGHNIISKTANFSTMVIFCFILLPFGYVLLFYTLYKSLFNVSVATNPMNKIHPVKEKLKQKRKGKSLGQKMKSAWKAVRKEFTEVVHHIEESDSVQHAEKNIHKTINDVEHHIIDEKNTIVNNLQTKEQTEVHKAISALHKAEKSKGEVLKTEIQNVEHPAQSKARN